MATVTGTYDNPDASPEATRTFTITWSGVVTGDTCVDMPCPGVLDTIHVFGTFNGGTTVTLQGSNQEGTPTSRIALNDIDGNPISFTAAGMKVVKENPVKVRPVVASGSSDAITIIVRCRI